MRPINDLDVNCDMFVQQKTLHSHTIKCWCGELWEHTFSGLQSARFITGLAAEEGWSLDDNLHPQCPKCLRKLKAGQRPKDPDDLGKNQRGLLLNLRDRGSWHTSDNGCSWLWDTPSNTKKILDTLVKRGLVHEEHGVYTPT